MSGLKYILLIVLLYSLTCSITSSAEPKSLSPAFAPWPPVTDKTNPPPRWEGFKVSHAAAVSLSKLLTRVDCSPDCKSSSGTSNCIVLWGMSVTPSKQWIKRSGCGVVWLGIHDLDYAMASLAVAQAKCLNDLKECVVSWTNLDWLHSLLSEFIQHIIYTAPRAVYVLLFM